MSLSVESIEKQTQPSNHVEPTAMVAEVEVMVESQAAQEAVSVEVAPAETVESSVAVDIDTVVAAGMPPNVLYQGPLSRRVGALQGWQSHIYALNIAPLSMESLQQFRKRHRNAASPELLAQAASHGFGIVSWSKSRGMDGLMDLREASHVTRAANRAHTLLVGIGRRTLTLAAPDADSCKAWLNAIEEVRAAFAANEARSICDTSSESYLEALKAFGGVAPASVVAPAQTEAEGMVAIPGKQVDAEEAKEARESSDMSSNAVDSGKKQRRRSFIDLFRSPKRDAAPVEAVVPEATESVEATNEKAAETGHMPVVAEESEVEVRPIFESEVPDAPVVEEVKQVEVKKGGFFSWIKGGKKEVDEEKAVEQKHEEKVEEKETTPDVPEVKEEIQKEESEPQQEQKVEINDEIKVEVAEEVKEELKAEEAAKVEVVETADEVTEAVAEVTKNEDVETAPEKKTGGFFNRFSRIFKKAPKEEKVSEAPDAPAPAENPVEATNDVIEEKAENEHAAEEAEAVEEKAEGIEIKADVVEAVEEKTENVEINTDVVEEVIVENKTDAIEDVKEEMPAVEEPQADVQQETKPAEKKTGFLGRLGSLLRKKPEVKVTESAKVEPTAENVVEAKEIVSDENTEAKDVKEEIQEVKVEVEEVKAETAAEVVAEVEAKAEVIEEAKPEKEAIVKEVKFADDVKQEADETPLEATAEEVKETFVKEGILMKQGAFFTGNWRRCYFQLRENGTLVYFKQDSASGKPAGEFKLLRGIVQQSHGSQAFAFKVTVSGKVLFLAAGSEEERAEWIEALESVFPPAEVKQDAPEEVVEAAPVSEKINPEVVVTPPVAVSEE